MLSRLDRPHESDRSACGVGSHHRFTSSQRCRNGPTRAVSYGAAVVADAEHDVPEGVELLSWPRDAALRRHLARSGVPRVVVVEAGATPPHDVDDPAETWVSATDRRSELGIAADRLVENLRRIDLEEVTIDDSGIARRGDRRVGLSPSEALVAGALVAEAGRVVSRGRLQLLLSEQGDRGDRALEAVIYRLRRRFVALHVVVRTVRTQGFVIDLRSSGRSPA